MNYFSIISTGLIIITKNELNNVGMYVYVSKLYLIGNVSEIIKEVPNASKLYCKFSRGSDKSTLFVKMIFKLVRSAFGDFVLKRY